MDNEPDVDQEVREIENGVDDVIRDDLDDGDIALGWVLTVAVMKPGEVEPRHYTYAPGHQAPFLTLGLLHTAALQEEEDVRQTIRDERNEDDEDGEDS